jgi:hypothetical protein
MCVIVVGNGPVEPVAPVKVNTGPTQLPPESITLVLAIDSPVSTTNVELFDDKVFHPFYYFDYLIFMSCGILKYCL